ncbi:MAG: type IV pilus assembly protein PilQ [Rhodocyclaceae bacterium]|nr:MAG: type IV pilus assembly protein PilQ [Rhodocyclaceae bacterium]TND05978.1 MAG: type IV pilus assembly protein PilQ [Rhodocyclaceae bacterium]
MNKFNTAACAILGFWLALPGATIAAENSIKQVQVRRDGDQMLLKVQMSAPLKSMPGNWSVVEPPRVVIDFPQTDNQSGQSTVQVAEGDLKSLNLVQTDKLTRLVLNLYRPTKFSTEIVGDVLFIKLQSQGVQASQEPAPSIYQPAATAALAGRQALAADTAAVRDILFRRGEDGQATITVDLTDGTVPIDIRRAGVGITVELRDVELPERLQNRRDVNDFATPVTTITSRAMGNMTRLDIAARGRWFHQAHLANNQLTIEVKPIPADEANKLVQSGDQGQKVSINFFGADAAMVLRTLADISGKNVLIDPSLNGRTVTANLDNIPYDQALEIIMAQVNSGMRVRNDVVLFGDRAVLQKRDQDNADELARASDIAPLVAETFKLNYVKAADIVSLVNSSFAAAPAAGAAGAPAAGAPAAPAAAGAPIAGSTGKGMLTSRGSISVHDATNQVFVRDTFAAVEAIREVIRNVDIPPKQVMIEARIVEASTGFSNSLGIRLNAFNYQQEGYKIPGTNTTRGVLSTAPMNTGNNLDIYGGGLTPSLTASTNIFRPSYTLAGAANFGLMLFNSAATKLISLELQAAENDSRNKTVSSPRIVTLNRKAATINSTQQVTILTGVNATTGLPIYQTFSAPLTLGVTPSVNPDNRISLELNIAKSTITNATTGSLDTNTITTSVIVENGGTVVIGGFARESDIQTQDRVPFLGDLPYVGFLFKTTTKSQSRSELLVFITPRIISETLTQR